MDDRIAALKTEMTQPQTDVDGDEEMSNTHNTENHVEDHQTAALNAPLSAGVDEAGDAPSAYPVENEVVGDYNYNEEGDIPYPTDVPYPVDEEGDGDIPYPVDVVYPVDEGDYAYPNTDAAFDDADDDNVAPYYYVDDDNDKNKKDNTAHDNNELKDDTTVEAPKKKFKGDQALVGFVPSNLQVRRRGKKKSSALRRKK